ncbi:MAG: helix-turn-helix transcriptional regulator, partial [Actinomycetota bacterium]|nr:helix-turn-helix transcriptional regulator [Actinomycetota bacterium]
MWRFGDFEADTASRELRHRGEVVHLEPQAFDLLVCLIEQRERVVSKVELLDGIWGHRFLSESNLTTRVKEVRRAVGDDGSRQHTIKNLRGQGYRFVGEVRTVAAAPSSELGLVGRSVELAAVNEALDVAQLVTLVGPGGVGKSSMARTVAHGAGSRWRDGVHLVELAALEDGAHVGPAVARSLGVVLDGARADDAARSIAPLDALVVLDNCEHVAEDATAFVAQLLRTPGDAVRVLATSQVPLGISGETILDIQPLASGAARELFTIRACAARRSWEGADDDRLDRLIAALDRLPLMIEMAAARLRSMTFDDLERVILEPHALMAVSHRSPTRRHRSLESLAGWSADLLEPSHRRLFTELSVFAGGVTATEAAAVVAPGEPEAVVRLGLAELAERSLLAADVEDEDGETRYVMLSTVRTVAARWLDESGVAAAVRDRHAFVVANALREVDDLLRTPREAEGRRRLASLGDEARAAHRWAQPRQPELAAQMSGSLFLAAYSTLWNEPAAWSEELLAGAPGRWLPGAQLTAASAAAHRGDLVMARERAAAVASGEGRLRASALEVLGDVALYEGDLEAVASAARRLVQLGRE